MGIKVEILGEIVEVSDYGVTEQSTPLSGSDTSGGVGSIRLNVPARDPHQGTSKLSRLRSMGVGVLRGAPVRLVDSRRGLTLGRLTDIRASGPMDELTIECSTRLAELNIYNVQAEPFSGTLRGAMEYYVTLAGWTDPSFLVVDNDIALMPFVAPGWTGELWYNLKRICQAKGVEINLISGTVIVSPAHSRRIYAGLATDRSVSTGGGTLAQQVEVYCYHTEAISNALVYPSVSGVEADTFNVSAGEITEYAITLSASVTDVTQPIAQDWVSPYEVSASVYSVLTSNGDRVPADLWRQYGGSVEIIIQPDTSNLRMIVTAPRGLLIGGAEPTGYTFADFADGSNARRATLRLVGTGVRHNREKLTFPTGVPAQLTDSIVGATVDNPFVATIDDAYRVANRTVFESAGLAQDLSVSLSSVSRRDATGERTMPTNAEVVAAILSAPGVSTNAQMQAYHKTTLGLKTNADVENYWYSTVRGRTDQAFGNVPGARLYDARSHSWYRVREANVSPEAISVTAEIDNLTSDAQATWGHLTYAGVQALFAGMTYQQVQASGLWRG